MYFIRTCSNCTKGVASKVTEGRFKLDIRKKFFPMRMGSPWHRLPRAILAAPSLQASKTRLDEAWTNWDSGR